MNGIITISDGSATLENGDLSCDDVNSSTLTTGTINTNIFTCAGEFRSNTIGPYTIPTLTSSEKGSLISYGNTSGNGATDFTNYGSTYTTTKQGFNFWNKNNTQTLINLAIIDNSQTYFKSQLIGCTAETPLNITSIVNKSYCDNNFVNLTTVQTITGNKTFTGTSTFNTVFMRIDTRWRDTISPNSNHQHYTKPEQPSHLCHCLIQIFIILLLKIH